MKKTIILTLANNFGNAVVEMVANSIGLFYLNLDEYIQYSLFNSNEMLIRCGKEYYDKQEKNVITECLDYENTLYFSSYETYIKNEAFFKDFQIIYLYLSREQLDKIAESNIIINRIAFDNRNKHLKSISKFVENNNLNKAEFAKKIIAIIRGEK